MLEQLENIALTLGLSFTYGELSAFNVTADKLIVWPLMYHEGYIEGSVKPDIQGLDEPTYSVTLWLLRPSQLSATPSVRYPTITELRDSGLSVLTALRKDNRVTDVRFKEGINLTSKNLDGVRFQFVATPKQLQPKC